MHSEYLACLLFTAGATHCALPCHRIAKVTSLVAAPRENWLDVTGLGFGSEGAGSPSRLLWLFDQDSPAPLPIADLCSLVNVANHDVLPLPVLHRRSTPFSALLRTGTEFALLLEPALLAAKFTPATSPPARTQTS